MAGHFSCLRGSAPLATLAPRSISSKKKMLSVLLGKNILAEGCAGTGGAGKHPVQPGGLRH